jgi:hypothetical protein
VRGPEFEPQYHKKKEKEKLAEKDLSLTHPSWDYCEDEVIKCQ